MHRTMFVEFPEDRNTHTLDRQYMLGPSLLVAPVYVSEKEETEYYLPAGKWTELTTGRTIVGPQWVRETVALDAIPVWIRSGSILALGPAGKGRPDYELSHGLDIRVFEIADGQTVQTTVPTGKGTTIGGTVKATRKGDEITVDVSGNDISLTSAAVFIDGYKLDLGGTSGATRIDDCSFSLTDKSTSFSIPLVRT